MIKTRNTEAYPIKPVLSLRRTYMCDSFYIRKKPKGKNNDDAMPVTVST